MLYRLHDWIWGYDFFVSYAHADGSLIEQRKRRSRYVRLLAEKLRGRNFSVCHDETEYLPGDDLNAATIRRVRASAKLLVIARSAAMVSDWVLKEANVALAAHNDVAVIDINETYQRLPADNPLRRAIGNNRLRFDEIIDDPDGEPSEALIDKLSSASQRSRRDRRRLRVIVGIALFLGFLAIIATGLGVYANAQRRLADHRRTQSLGVVETMLIDVDRSLESVPEAAPIRRRLLGRVGQVLETLQKSDDALSSRLRMIEHGSLAEQAYTHQDLAAARREREQALVIAHGLLKRANPGARGDLIVSYLRLVQVLLDLGDLASAEPLLEEALSVVREELLPDSPQDGYYRGLAGVLDRFGDLQLHKGDMAAAIKYYRETVITSRTLLALSHNQLRDLRDHVVSVGNLVDAMISAHDLTNAIPLADEAVQLSRDTLKEFPNNPDVLVGLASSLSGRANLHFYLGKYLQSKELFNEMESTLRRLLLRDSSNRESLRNLAIALQGRSKVEKELGDLKAARDLTIEAMGVRRQLAALDESNKLHQWDLAVELEILGDRHGQMSELPESELAYREAVDVLRRLVSSDGGANAHYQTSLGSSLMRLGFSQLMQGKLEDVREIYEEALGIQRSLAKARPNDATYRNSVALTLEGLADLALRERQFKEAQSLGEEAMKIRRAVADQEPGSVGFANDLAESLVYTAKAYWRSGDAKDRSRGNALLDEAIERLRRHKDAGRLAEDPESAKLLEYLEAERARIVE